MKNIFVIMGLVQFLLESCKNNNEPELCDCAKNLMAISSAFFDSSVQKNCDRYYSRELFTEANIENSQELKRCLKDDIFYSRFQEGIKYKKEMENERVKRRELGRCEDQSSFDFGYNVAQDQLGKGLMADCEYLYEMAITQRINIDHRCFCKGVNFWIKERQ